MDFHFNEEIKHRTKIFDNRYFKSLGRFYINSPDFLEDLMAMGGPENYL